ncbi:MAG: hypothetical protein WBO10_07925 [Pyrinomonadaceae bacterium]
MAKMTQAEIKAKADEWARLDGKIKKAESDKTAALEPFVTEFNERTATVAKRYDKRIGKLVEERATIEDEVTEWLEKHGKAIALAGDLAVAANELKVGSRSIDPETFFDRVKDRSKDFWNCVGIAIAKAEKLIGSDKVDEMSSKTSKMVATLKLK